MKASEIMTANPRVVTPDTPVQQAARLMHTEDTGVLPVVESQQSRKLVGVVTDRDIAIRVVAEGLANAEVRDAMTSDVLTAKPDDTAKEVMLVMSREQVRRIPVVDGRGNVVGIISQADVVRTIDGERAEETVERISRPGGSHNL